MDAARVAVLRDLLATTGWIERTADFASTMRHSTRDPGGLLLVGTPDDEPWHLAAHLTDESQRAGVPELRPTLVRHSVPVNAPPHLSVTLQRLEVAKRGETVMVVAETAAPEQLLQRAWDARQLGATVLSVDDGDPELADIAHERLIVADSTVAIANMTDVLTFDAVQHLVSVAAGESRDRLRLRDRIARALEAVSGPRHTDW